MLPTSKTSRSDLRNSASECIGTCKKVTASGLVWIIGTLKRVEYIRNSNCAANRHSTGGEPTLVQNWDVAGKWDTAAWPGQGNVTFGELCSIPREAKRNNR